MAGGRAGREKTILTAARRSGGRGGRDSHEAQLDRFETATPTMFFCIPILCGCESNIQPNGEVQTARICPNCHNASVFSGKNSEWFTFFFVPLFPLSSKHVWLCGTCRWMAPHAPGHFEPAIAFGGGFPPQGPPMMPMQPSYQPGYVNPPQPFTLPYQPTYVQGAATPAPK